MKSELKTKDAGTGELSVELDQNELHEYLKDARQHLTSQVQLDGFRPGKAPQELTEKQLDQKQLLAAALELAVQDSLSKVLEERTLDVRKVSDLTLQDNTQEKLRYRVMIHLFPDIELPDLARFQVSRKTANVENKEIQEALEVVRNVRSTLHPKEGIAQEGDRVEVHFEVTSGGKLIEGGESKNHPLIIGGKTFIPGFEEQLIGMHKDEEKTFSLTAPADYVNKTVAGKQLDFKVKIATIQRVEKPELTDAFAQRMGKFKDLKHLKQSIREGLEEEKRQKERQRVQLELLERVREATKIKAPSAMIEEQLDVMVKDFDQNLHERGLELGMYLAHLKKTQEELRSQWRKEAERQVQISCILHKVARQEHITAGIEEVEGALNDAMQSLIASGGVELSQVNVEGVRKQITDRIIVDKTLNFLEQKCVTGEPVVS